jgi:hypothetical protein
VHKRKKIKENAIDGRFKYTVSLEDGDEEMILHYACLSILGISVTDN